LETIEIIMLAGLAAVIVIGIIVGAVFRSNREKNLMHRDLPDDWLLILKRNVALYRYLPDDLKEELHGRINIFMDEKDFEGCGGLTITTEIKVTIAAQASILLLRKNLECYPSLHSVLVYPSAYVTHGAKRLGEQVVQGGEAALSGESWTYGDVILTWDAVKYESRKLGIGNNVVLHEFAHQLDQANGVADGIPILRNREEYERWNKIMDEEFNELCNEAENGIEDVMDEYGATNHAEFFAVATEAFFSCPKLMQKKHSALYQELKEFYRLDPAAWNY
jgi:Mlc titration factor MtfA (ptsG expression regulator)